MNDLLKRNAQLEKQIEILKLRQLNRSSEMSNTCENEEKQHPQDDPLPSTSKSSSFEATALPPTSSKKVSTISTTTSSEIVASSDNSGKTYSEKVQNEKDRKQLSIYKKRKGTTDYGREYEYLMCTYYALKLCFDENVVDFEITTNNTDYGDFDDIALKVTFRDKSSHHFLIQLKHTEQTRGITNQMLSAEKGDFSLFKYYDSFQKLQDRDNVICIAFTNRKSQLNDKSELKLEDESISVNQCQRHNINHLLIDTVSGDETAHIFSFKQNGQNSQNFEIFFKRFYLFTNQKNSSNMQLHVDKLLYERFESFGCKVDFIGFMRHWWKGPFVLYKHDIIMKLAELVLSPFIQEIPKNVNEPLSDKAKLLKYAIMQFEMTLVNDCDANAIANILIEESVDDGIISRTSFKYGLISSTRLIFKEDLTSEQFTKVLWYLNKAPLIVKYDEKEEKRIRVAIELLAMESDKKKLVLVGYNSKEVLSKWIIFESLYDLRTGPVYKKITESFKVSLQGRQSIDLEKFINSDTETAKVLEFQKLFLMLEEDLCIGGQLPSLPAVYIERTLKHNNFLIDEDNAFVVLNHPVNIVIGKPGIGKSTLMTYLSRHCPPNYWCLQVTLKKYSKLFSEEHSTEEIMNEFLKYEDAFFNKVKASFLQSKRIYLLLDGLDEIEANSIENVLTFIKDISSNGIRVWISSREHLKDKLTNDFKISPITIEEPTEEKIQKKYIEQRLYNTSEDDETGVNYTEDEVKEIITRVFTSVSFTYNAKNILGVPFLLFIITEIFRNDKLNLEKMKKEDIFVLTKMYKIFVQGKVKSALKNVAEEPKGALLDYLCYILKQYELPALEGSASPIFEKLEMDSRKKIKCQEFLTKIQDKGDPHGIISEIVGEKDGLRAIFTHQSFAEYFACVWLTKNKEKLKSIKDLYLKASNENLRLIFDILLAEDKPLHLAVVYKNPEQVEEYINRYEERDEGGRSALHLISTYCENDLEIPSNQNEAKVMTDLNILKKLLVIKCDPFEEDILLEGNCFDYALHTKHLLPLEVILETQNNKNLSFKNINDIDMKREKLLERCCYFGYSNLLKRLIRSKVEQPQEFCSGCFNLLKMLNRRNYPTSLQQTQFGNLIKQVITGIEDTKERYWTDKYSEIVKQLIDCGCKINEKIDEKYNALQLSCFNGNYNMVAILLALKANKNVVTEKGESVLHLAVNTDDAKLVKLLLEEEKTLADKADNDKWTPLHYACKKGYVDVVKTLLTMGANVNAITNKKQIPLHIAAENGDPKIIKLLFDKGGEINKVDDDSWTPLHSACSKGNYDAAKTIVELKGDINAVNNDGRIPLHLASTKNKNIVIYLLEKGSNIINAEDKYAWTPLRCACEEKKYDVIEVLLENRARLDEECRSILSQNFYEILYKGREHLVEQLLKLLSSKDVTFSLKKLPPKFPIDLAKKNGQLQDKLLLKMATFLNELHGDDYSDAESLHFEDIDDVKSSISIHWYQENKIM